MRLRLGVIFIALSFPTILCATQKDTAVETAEYSAPSATLTGILHKAKANYLEGPDDSIMRDYYYIHLDRGLSAFSNDAKDDANSTALHQYDISIALTPSVSASQIRELLGKRVSIEGTLSSGNPHSAGPTDITILARSVKTLRDLHNKR